MSPTNTEPKVYYKPVESDIKRLPSAFQPLSPEEKKANWGVELMIGQQFARSLDLYRAITAFKRALFLVPTEESARRFQIEYSIVESYFLAGKCNEALQAFEESSLNTANPETLPPFRELLIIVFDCYERMGEVEKAEKVLKIIRRGDTELATTIQLGIAIRKGDIPEVRALSEQSKKGAPVIDFIKQYESHYKTPWKAQLLNALLPGAGYFYTGQRMTALTALIINALFIWATIALYRKGHYAIALIFLSLELGWYIGGINGAGLAAKEWNEQFYDSLGNGMMTRNDLYPFLMLETIY